MHAVARALFPLQAPLLVAVQEWNDIVVDYRGDMRLIRGGTDEQLAGAPHPIGQNPAGQTPAGQN